MRAIDTNVLVRLAARDDREQTVLAEGLLDEQALVLPTVALETVWVLASTYRMTRSEIVERLSRILGHPMIASDAAELHWALGRYRAGADFADMLHVALAAKAAASRFATFDRRLAKSGAAEMVPIEVVGA